MTWNLNPGATPLGIGENPSLHLLNCLSGVNSNVSNSNNHILDTISSDLVSYQENVSNFKEAQFKLIQNFSTSYSQFQSVSDRFFATINQNISQISDYYNKKLAMQQEQISTLITENTMMKSKLQQQEQKSEQLACKILSFCDKHLNPTEFEFFIAALFDELGYNVEHAGKTHDGGIDVNVRHPTLGIGVVQVKQYGKNSKVTESQIRDLWGAATADDCDYAVMVTLSDATKEAKSWPQRKNVNLKLWTGKDLVRLLKQKECEILITFLQFLQKSHHDKIERVRAKTAKETIASMNSNSTNVSICMNNNLPLTPGTAKYSLSQRRKATLSSAKKKRKNRDSQEHTDRLLSEMFGKQIGLLKHKQTDMNVDEGASTNVIPSRNLSQTPVKSKTAKAKDSNASNVNKSNPEQSPAISFSFSKGFQSTVAQMTTPVANKSVPVPKHSVSPAVANKTAGIKARSSSLLLEEDMDATESDTEDEKDIQGNGTTMGFAFGQTNAQPNVVSIDSNHAKHNASGVFSSFAKNKAQAEQQFDKLFQFGKLKSKKPRRVWSYHDDALLTKAVNQHKNNWAVIFDLYGKQFEQNWDATDLRQHYTKVLLPRLQKRMLQQMQKNSY